MVIEIKSLAEKAIEADIDVQSFAFGSEAHQRADEKRILALSAFRQKATPLAVLKMVSMLGLMSDELKVFADEASQYDKNDDDRVREDCEIATGSDFTVGELRQARQALRLMDEL